MLARGWATGARVETPLAKRAAAPPGDVPAASSVPAGLEGGERLSFDEGAARGGQVLYEEPERFQRARRRANLYGLCACLALLALLAGIAFALGGGLWLAAAGGASAATSVACIFLLREWERSGRLKNTPFRIYAEGISTGKSERPYRPFSGLYAVEDELSYKGKAPFTELTFMDGTGETLSFASFASGNIVIRKDYRLVHDLLHQKFPKGIYPRMAWSMDAEAFMATVKYTKGATRVWAEALARKQGRSEVDLAFIREYWKDIGAHEGLGINTFKGRAIEAFEKKARASK